MKDRDEFWDLSSLLPSKPRKLYASTNELSPKEISLRAEVDAHEERSLYRLYPQNERRVFREDAVSWNPLIHGVKISTTPNTYKLHHLFKEDAVRYFGKKGAPCDYAPCYSYIPQYSQLNASQRAYYFYFREQADQGNYIQINQSYFLLYVYEILNLPDYISPKDGVVRLARIWAAYRKVLTGIDKYMVAWIADYALIHGVPCPFDVLQPFLHEVLSLSSLKEFYLAGTDTLSDCQFDAFLALSSAYSYKSSRYAQGESGELLLKHVKAACHVALRELFKEEAECVSFQTVKKEYPAYVGALCSEAERYTIEVSYCSVSGTESLRTLVTSLVKYAENKVRAACLIKSRLSVSYLPPRYKDILDAYFSENLPIIREKGNAVISRPSYEEMYDAVSVGFSADAAQQIEEESWRNTRLLVSSEEIEEVFLSPIPSSSQEETEGLPLKDIVALALLVCKSEQSARAYLAKDGELLENSVARINEYFIDLMGDIVISVEDEMNLIDDYETEVAALITPYENIWKTLM